MFSDRAQRRLNDIIKDADDIVDFMNAVDSAEAFMADRRTMYAVERLLQRITEAVTQIGPEEMSQVEPSVAVTRLRALGNRLRHEYWDIDPPTIFTIARESVPALREAAARALSR